MATITGTTGNDSLSAAAGADLYQGLAGNDTIEGGAGNDTLDGGDGNDRYVFGSGWGNDSIIENFSWWETLDFGAVTTNLTINLNTGTGNEVVSGTNTINFSGNIIHQVYSGSGSDSIIGNSNDNVFTGHDGNDTLLGGAGNDTMFGDLGNDSVDGGDGNDQVEAGDGSDTLIGGLGDDRINAGGGNDIIDGGEGNDEFHFNSGWGSDTILDGTSYWERFVFYTGNENITVNLTSSTGNEVTDGTNTINWANDIIDQVIMSGGNDRIYGSSTANYIEAQDGNDSIDGGGGNDTLDGGNGDDTYNVGTTGFGDDTIIDTVGANFLNLELIR